MSVINNNLLLTAAAAGGYQVQRSLRFNSADSAYLSRAFPSAGNRKTWTLSWWVKRSVLGTTQQMFAGPGNPVSGPNWLFIYFNTANQLAIYEYDGASVNQEIVFAPVFRDVSAWYHFVYTFDSTQSTVALRQRVYVNGTEISLSSGTRVPQNYDSQWNKADTFNVGRHSSGAYLDGYMAEIHFIDGQALDPTSFATTDATTGQWIPKLYSGSYGSQGFKLTFADNSNNTASTLGKDTSGNSPANNWTPNNFSVLNGGATTVTTPATNSPPTIDFLVIGGGGGGTGGAFSGGGGAGGYRTSVGTSGGGASAESPVTVTASTAYSVIVGAGGALSANGSNSVFGPITSLGGGRGGGSVSSQVGGSGGGGGPLTISPAGSAGTANQGFAGADGNATNSATPGGGGAGGAGSAASGSTGGAGGAGITSSITGTAVTRAAGGRGGDQNSNGVAGAPNTGNGAQGHWNGTGAVGGSGIVILRYANTYADLIVGSGLTYTYANTGGYKIYSFTASTTFAEGAGNDALTDSPTSYGTDTGLGGEVTGNYCTFNPLASTSALSNGNLDTTMSAYPTDYGRGTIGIASGKYYFEATVTSGGQPLIGISPYGSGGSVGNYYGYHGAGYIYGLGGYVGPPDTPYTVGDIIGIAIDITAGSIKFYKNNSLVYTFTGIASSTYFPFYAGTNGGSTVVSWNFGQRAFAYTAPSGFKALCDTNLTAPVIANPNTAFDVVTYTGNGSARSITLPGGFSPDLIWTKSRSAAYFHHLYDIVRGTNSDLCSNSTTNELTGSPYNDGVTAFNSSGYSLGTFNGLNENGTTYVAWAWDGGSSTVTNTQGSINSQVRANPSSGFSVISYTANGTAGATIGHSLGVAPQFLIVKNRSGSQNWFAYHASVGATKGFNFNETGAAITDSGYWNNTAPTSTLITLGNYHGYFGSANFICYAWAPVAGYSSFGSYVGNGSSDGPFQWCGFRPRWVLYKESSVAGSSWEIIDAARNPYNASNARLFPDSSGAENTAQNALDLLSNGFKPRATYGGNNASGATYIWAAFAESPFQYARAR